MHLEADAVARAVADDGHALLGGLAGRVAAGLQRRERRRVHGVAGDARANRRGRRVLGAHHGRVHRCDFARDRAVHHGARHVAVVERRAVPREDVDDHGLARAEDAVSMVVAVGALRAACDDRLGVVVALLEEMDVDDRAQALGRERRARVDERAVGGG